MCFQVYLTYLILLGKENDRVGPGHYDTEKAYSLLLHNKGTSFKIPNAERKTLFGKSNTLDLGPGEYEQEYKLKRNSSMISQPVHLPIKSKAKSIYREHREPTYLDDLEDSSDDGSGPGPGNYDPHVNSGFKKVEVRKDLQFFGSAAQRFHKQLDNTRVGPGAYNLAGKPSRFSIK